MDGEQEAIVPFGTFRPSERRALIGCAFAAGCILLMPQELIGAAIAFAAAGGFTVWHLVRSHRELKSRLDAAKAQLAAARAEVAIEARAEATAALTEALTKKAEEP